MTAAPNIDLLTLIRRVVRDLLDRFKQEWQQEQDEWLQCTVVNVTAGNPATGQLATVDLTIGGRTSPVTGVRYAASYPPNINDVVWAIYRKGDLQVVYKLA